MRPIVWPILCDVLELDRSEGKYISMGATGADMFMKIIGTDSANMAQHIT